jgi:hypothetical protein
MDCDDGGRKVLIDASVGTIQTSACLTFSAVGRETYPHLTAWASKYPSVDTIPFSREDFVMAEIPEPTFRDWLGDWKEHARPTREVWDVVLTIVGILIPLAVYYGLIKTNGPPWAPIVAAAVVAAIYFATIVHFKIWKAKEMEIRQLKNRLIERIRLFLNERNGGIQAAKMTDGRDRWYVQVCATSSTEATLHDCIAHLVEIAHRPTSSVDFREIKAEALPLPWGYQPTLPIVLTKQISHRFNLISFDADNKIQNEALQKPVDLKEFYEGTGKTGEYRFRVYVCGRGMVPTERHIYVSWASPNNLPHIKLADVSHDG